jgi:hypothetical protein
VGKKYGGGTTYKAVWGRMNQINKNAKLINEACDAGLDPLTVNLVEAPAQTGQPKGKGSQGHSLAFFIRHA